MLKLREYPVSVSKNLHKATRETIFRKQTNDWRDVDYTFNRIADQALRISEQDPRFQFEGDTMLYGPMTILKLTRTFPDGEAISFKMMYQQEVDEAHFVVQVLDQGIRLKTAWFPPGLLAVGPLCQESVLEFEPCLINEHFVEHIIEYMIQQKNWMEARIKLYGELSYPGDVSPFFDE
ncbi:hypothetical protein EVJ33_08375 [Exiguobacterium sp. SL-10]|uniref:hypothetical protein n=1 Tax=Exiguobacterium sp. SL-10 TaxID=2510962 RepID=UPI00103A0F83|nr:hypothetical protein [Exiguobacterium sp. SL-10]TCI29660.1 hypothetical protein EVJ33_08375 [Exiguobacterium sp. SL-10]